LLPESVDVSGAATEQGRISALQSEKGGSGCDEIIAILKSLYYFHAT